ncbi:MAG TPA: MurT ligase domain-containing protein [Acidimicrobiales bacterium]
MTPTAPPSPATRHRPATRVRLVAAAVRASGGVSRRLGRGGSVIGGHVGLRLDKDAIAHLAEGRWIATVSGTNGKTTTTHLLAAALGAGGRVVTNAAGANLRTGVVAALSNDLWCTRAALEVDEATLAVVAAELRPAVIVLLNLSRDQLDRYGEVRIIGGRWRTMLGQLGAGVAPVPAGPSGAVAAGAAHVVANADDPLVVWSAEPARDVTWVAAGAAWTADAAVCPECGGVITHDNGGWRCDGCPLTRPEPHYHLEGDVLVAPDGHRVELRLQLPGRFNVANAAMAAAAAAHAGVPLAAAAAAMAGTTEVAGRYRSVTVGAHDVRLLMAKNPAGWQEALGILGPPPTPVIVGINARVADGHDPSWLWDVPFELLQGRTVVATGDRARDLSVRLHYAGVPHTVHLGTPLDAARTFPPGDVDLVGNYTVFADVLEGLR